MSAVLAQRPSHLAAHLATQRGERDPWPAALAIALTLEVALLAGLLSWSAHQAAPVPPAPVDIVLQPSPAPTVQAPSVPKPTPPKSVELPRPRPPDHPAPRPVRTPATPSPPPPAPAPTPTAVAAPPPAPDTRPALPVAAATPAPTPPPTESDTGARRAAFEAQLRAAVQASVHYPAAAKLMHLHGKTLVAFDYEDRRVSQVRVAQSSGSAELDRAALAAVQGAEFPPPPGELAGRTLHFDVWVRFFLQDEAD